MPPKNRRPDYEQRSAALRKKVDEQESKNFALAKLMIDKMVVESVEALGKLLKNKSAKVKLGAIKQVHSVAGLEIQRIEASGKDGQPLTLVIKKYQENGN